MATYKVIQDIEAEDKLVGPFSLRQFIYAGIAAFMGYLSVISVMNGAAFMLVILAPPMLFCMFFAWPWSPDQPTEVWALARIRFYLKSRRRVWDQSGINELVTITAPKKIEKIFTDGLSQHEVRSRLQTLADTIDSRGWVIKNANLNMSTAPQYASAGPTDDSDRLISMQNMPQEVPAIDIQPADDILDERNNPVAHKVDEMISASTQAHRQQLMEKMRDNGATVPDIATPQPPGNNWFMSQQQVSASLGVQDNGTAGQPVATSPLIPTAGIPTYDETRLIEEARARNSVQSTSYSHLRNIAPPSSSQPVPAPNPVAAVPSTADAAILNLANNNDLNVATLAREANKARRPKEPPEGEVVISLR